MASNSVADGPDQAPSPATDPHGGVRRRAAYFYGLVVCGAVLAADPETVKLWVVGVALVSTAAVYWVAETYVHWCAARTAHRRDLTSRERWALIADGFPLVLACGIPAAVLFVEAIAGISTPTAVDVALVITVLLLVAVGWQMSPGDRRLAPRRLWYAAVTGLLGLAMIGLKAMLH